MPEVILPRLLLKGGAATTLTVGQGRIADVLVFISSQLSIPKEILLKNDGSLSGSVALFCNGSAVYDLNLFLKDSDVLEIVMALSGG